MRESTANKQGSVVWGGLQHESSGWGSFALYERSDLFLEVESRGKFVGSATFTPQELMRAAVDEDG